MSTDSNSFAFHTLLSMYHILESLRALCLGADVPIMVSNPLDLIWIAEAEHQDGKLFRIHIAGPVFTGNVSRSLLTSSLEKLQLSIPLKHQILNLIHSLPLFSIAQTTKLGQLLHYFIHRKRIGFGDFIQLGKLPADEYVSSYISVENTSYRTNFVKEQTLLQMFREGRLDLCKQIGRLDFQDLSSTFIADGSLRDIKNTVISGITLYSRSSM